MRKKMKLVAVVATLLIAAAGLSTISSCKKDKNTMLEKQIVQNCIKHPEKIEDMDAYLKDFGNKMLNSKNNEFLTTEEAAWHITAYLNFQYGDVTDDYSDYDISYKEYTIPVSNGLVTLSDLGLLYNNTAKDIVKFYQASMFNDKKILYVQTEIGNTGNVKVTAALTYKESSQLRYFDFDDYVDSVLFCDSLFPNQQGYLWNTEATQLLTELIRHFSHATLRTADYERKYYISIKEDDFTHKDYPGQIYYCGCCTYTHYISPQDMCFYLDSYLDIIFENKPERYDVVDCYVYEVDNNKDKESPDAPVPYYHGLYIKCGLPIVSSIHPNFN